jgi:hypothetical protein
MNSFCADNRISRDLAQRLVKFGFWSFADLACIDPKWLAKLGQMSEDEAYSIIAWAEASDTSPDSDNTRGDNVR